MLPSSSPTGLSAASGIPTFRGAGGLWRSHDAMQLATPQAFASDPSKVWQFYHYRRELCLKARPNMAHETLAFLATAEGAREIFPAAKEGFHLVTQKCVEPVLTKVTLLLRAD